MSMRASKIDTKFLITVRKLIIYENRTENNIWDKSQDEDQSLNNKLMLQLVHCSVFLCSQVDVQGSSRGTKLKSEVSHEKWKQNIFHDKFIELSPENLIFLSETSSYIKVNMKWKFSMCCMDRYVCEVWMFS